MISKMKKIKILIPKIRPPEISDYATTQIREIILALKNEYDVEEHWLIFQPDKVKTIHQENFHQINYQDYEDATDILKQINPDIVLVEGILGINGISFSLACKFLQIPIVSLFTTLGNFGSEKKMVKTIF